MIIVYIDGLVVYGFDYEWVDWLWVFEGGKLKVLVGNLLFFNMEDGEFFGEIIEEVLEMDNVICISEKLYVVGDVCVNENLLLLFFYILFVWEYNCLCDELVIKYLDWDDEVFY